MLFDSATSSGDVKLAAKALSAAYMAASIVGVEDEEGDETDWRQVIKVNLVEVFGVVVVMQA